MILTKVQTKFNGEIKVISRNSAEKFEYSYAKK